MIDTVMRVVVPDKVRSKAGTWMMKQASRSKQLLAGYVKLVHGYDVADNLAIHDNVASYTFQDRRIACPIDGVGSFFEVFCAEVYDKPWLFLRYGGVVIDVGAYTGMFAVKRAIAHQSVLAIEPCPDNWSWLQANTNKLPVTLVKCAAAEYVGEKTLYLSDTSSCHSTCYKQARSIEVPAKTLDRIAEEYGVGRVDLLKIDAEGSEKEVLLGARVLLQHTERVAIASYSDSDIRLMKAFLTARGFKTQTSKGLRRYLYAEKGV